MMHLGTWPISKPSDRGKGVCLSYSGKTAIARDTEEGWLPNLHHVSFLSSGPTTMRPRLSVLSYLPLTHSTGQVVSGSVLRYLPTGRGFGQQLVRWFGMDTTRTWYYLPTIAYLVAYIVRQRDDFQPRAAGIGGGAGPGTLVHSPAGPGGGLLCCRGGGVTGRDEGV
ncbi:hypothetical protein LX32DRAFT_415899 [Colletotrichum zoysiae]|uniref:Uncharacterized protein n=1 Tax=Colletotrichum zoysiae TaxID=1216348 RepID=A0AAD9M0G2_9PEZI|nr:hypothetical protein LX32DRAFT_415899 [Colletotrichum zoysiae]